MCCPPTTNGTSFTICGSGNKLWDRALTVAKFRHATLLSNDKQARSAAEEEGIPISGAIGVLECAVEMESIQPNTAVAILEDMIREGAWISRELLELFRQGILHEN